MLTKSQVAFQKLREVDNAYRAKHAAAHDTFNKTFDRLLRKHGGDVTPTKLASVNNLPQSMYEDPEFIAAKQAHVDAITKARHEQRNHVATMPYSRVQFQRTVRMQ